MRGHLQKCVLLEQLGLPLFLLRQDVPVLPESLLVRILDGVCLRDEPLPGIDLRLQLPSHIITDVLRIVVFALAQAGNG